MKSFLHTLAAILLGLYAPSCSYQIPRADISNPSAYDFNLTEVRVPAEFKSMCGEEHIEKADSAGILRLVFENGMIKIFWIPTDMFLAFTLENKTDDSLTIMWRGAAYVDGTGAIDNMTHGGVAYVDAFYIDRPKQPSVVIGKGSVTDWVVPERCVYRAAGFMAGTGSVDPMFSGDPASYIGKSVKVMLPLMVGEKTIEYTFVFDINSRARRK